MARRDRSGQQSGDGKQAQLSQPGKTGKQHGTETRDRGQQP